MCLTIRAIGRRLLLAAQAAAGTMRHVRNRLLLRGTSHQRAQPVEQLTWPLLRRAYHRHMHTPRSAISRCTVSRTTSAHHLQPFCGNACCSWAGCSTHHSGVCGQLCNWKMCTSSSECASSLLAAIVWQDIHCPGECCSTNATRGLVVNRITVYLLARWLLASKHAAQQRQQDAEHEAALVCHILEAHFHQTWRDWHHAAQGGQLEVTTS